MQPWQGAPQPPDPAPLLDHHEDIAYMNDGPELTVLAALTAMHAVGRIAPSGHRCVHAVGLTYASNLERAIRLSTQHPVLVGMLSSAPPVADALGHIERRLIKAGLLLTVEQRERERIGCLDMILVAMVGMIGIVVMMGSVLFGVLGNFLLGGVIILFALAAMGVLSSGEWRTDRGDAELTRLRAEHAGLSPQLRPARAALKVAIFGASALWNADPVFAKALGVPRPGDDGI